MKVKKIGSIILAVILILSFLCFPVSAKAQDVFYTVTRGDINADGIVTLQDARTILQIAVGLKTTGDDYIKAISDMDDDGKITTSDAKLALRVAANIDKPRIMKLIDKVQPEENNDNENPGVETPEGEITPPSTAYAGNFTFTSYGFGHGVGLSQWGAEAMALNGYKYTEILSNYFAGTSLTTNTSLFPAKITYNGTSYSFKEAVARIASAEMGLNFESDALKAQIVAISSYLFYRNRSATSWNVSGVAFSTSAANKEMLAIVNELYGQYLTYEGKPIEATFFSASAGKTTNSENVWTGTVPYLRAADSHWEIQSGMGGARYYGVTYKISAQELYKKIIDKYPNITLSKNPSEWIQILSHDSAISKNIGYISKMKIGNMELKGNTMRSILGSSNLKSPCFTVKYTTDSYLMPVVSTSYCYVSSQYGMRDGKMHNGVDIAAPSGSKILCTKDGTVTELAYNENGYGNYLVVTHNDGTTSLYAHCSSVVAKINQKVSQGNLIAYVGSTGNSTGPHLHFEITVNGKRIDPETVIKV